MKRFKFAVLIAGFCIFAATAIAQDKKPAPPKSASATEKVILVKFKAEAKPAQIHALQSELGLEQIKEIPAISVRVYKITSAKSLKEVIERSSKQAFVEYAEPNQTYKALK